MIKLDMLGEGGVAAACSMWEWGCKRDAGRREGHRRDVARGRDTGGMQQEGGTQEGCSRREGHRRDAAGGRDMAQGSGTMQE